MSAANTKPNFFFLLGIHPDAPWDKARIEQIIRDKRIEWSRKSNGIGRSASEAKKNLEQVQEITRLMTDRTEYEKQAQAAREEQSSTQKADIERLKKAVDFINAKGYIEQSELDALIKDFSTLPPAEIHKYIQVEVGAKPASQAAGSTVQPMEESLLKKINSLLETVHMETLYQLVGHDKTVSNAKLCEAADAVYNDMVQRQVSVETGAKKELAGHAKSVFGSTEKRRSYDESLRLRSLDEILQDLTETVNRSSDKEVSAGLVKVFLERSRKAGWQDDVALAKLKDLARQRKWFVDMPTLDIQAPQLVRCGHCDEMNESGRKRCHRCNEELMTSCPNCGATVLADAISCGSCGFAVGDRFYVDSLLKKITFIQDPKETQSLLDEAAALWNPGRPDARVQKIRDLKATLQNQLNIQQELQKQLSMLIDQRQLFQARQFLAEKREKITNPQHYQSLIEEGITQARNCADRAQRAKEREEKADLYRQALHLCSDYREAREQLSTMPPTSATHLQAKVSGTRVSLTWTSSPTRDVTYKVVRTVNSQPVSPADGTQLALVKNTVYEDTQPEIGIPLYYGVFTECEGVVAAQPTLLSAALFLTQDILDEIVEVNNGQIMLTWQNPSHVQQILIVRKEGLPPGSLEDGVRLTVHDAARFVDHNVVNEQVYYYKIHCQFNNQGKAILSAGKIIKARPEAPPAAVMNMDISNEKTSSGHRVHLKWSAPDKGRVVVLKSRQKPKIAVGDILPLAQLKQHGDILAGQAETLSDNWTQQGECYYTPVVTLGNTAYIGAGIRYACIDDVEELRYENLGTALRLQWNWPQNCQEVVVFYNNEGWQGKASSKRNISRAEYDHLGYLEIKGAQQCNYYIHVCALIRHNGQQLQATGVRLQARLASKIVLTYEIKKARFSKKRLLQIHPRSAGTLLPLVLVCKRGGLPSKRLDGEPIWQLKEPLQVDKEVTFELPERTPSPQTYCKLYMEEDSAYEFTTILHPSDMKLRLD